METRESLFIVFPITCTKGLKNISEYGGMIPTGNIEANGHPYLGVPHLHAQHYAAEDRRVGGIHPTKIIDLLHCLTMGDGLHRQGPIKLMQGRITHVVVSEGASAT